jgi:hypothetical protein
MRPPRILRNRNHASVWGDSVSAALQQAAPGHFLTAFVKGEFERPARSKGLKNRFLAPIERMFDYERLSPTARFRASTASCALFSFSLKSS